MKYNGVFFGGLIVQYQVCGITAETYNAEDKGRDKNYRKQRKKDSS